MPERPCQDATAAAAALQRTFCVKHPLLSARERLRRGQGLPVEQRRVAGGLPRARKALPPWRAAEVCVSQTLRAT